MCGIAGIFHYRTGSPVAPPRLRAMTEILVHRGPDGSGYYIPDAGPVGLGHRRLAIIDLETGDQPIPNESGEIWITFNGEIYNYRELKQDLSARGHRFKTKSDTEVVVHAYEEWGDSCPTRLNGIFAFSIWDQRRKRLFLARDHFGVKPLYYYDNGTSFLFASELKSILVDPDVPREMDLDALNLCLTFRYTPSPWTLFRGIRRVPSASSLVVTPGGVTCQSYADRPSTIDRARSEGSFVEELRAEYQTAVRRQMVSDVPIGLSLSGGVDSSTLLALMSGVSPHVHTFTVGFEGGAERDNEIPLALNAAARFSAVPESRFIAERDYIEFMEQYLWHLEEPIGNESAAAYHFVAKLAQGKVKVLLSGQGADEPFAGYGRHIAARHAPLFLSGAGRLLSGILPKRLPFSFGMEAPGRVLRYLRSGDELTALLGIYSITTPEERRSILRAEARSAIDENLPARILGTQLDSAPAGSFLEKMTYIDARTSLPDNLLLCGDKMAMAAGIEMRVPFLDRNVMRVAEQIPGEMKVKGLATKVIHKRACERWLPASEVYRRKVGFNNPMKKWLRQSMESRMQELIAQPDSLSQTYLNPDYLIMLIRRHREGEEDYHRLLFLLFSLETWYNVFVKANPRSA